MKSGTLDIKFHNKPVYDEKYIKTKVKTFNEVVNVIFSDNEIPKERIHYTCLAAMNIDSVMRTDKKNYPQVYLEGVKKKIKKKIKKIKKIKRWSNLLMLN